MPEMHVFGFGEGLRANPGQGRDFYDDRLPAETLGRLKEVLKAVSPNLRPFLVETQSKLLFAKDPQFYEGMVCGIAMVGQMMADLAAVSPGGSVLYDGLRGLAGVQAAAIVGHVIEAREAASLAASREKRTHPEVPDEQAP